MEPDRIRSPSGEWGVARVSRRPTEVEEPAPDLIRGGRPLEIKPLTLAP